MAKLEPSGPSKQTQTRADAVVARPKAAKATRGRRLSGKRDLDDGIPPSVAVQESKPMNKEAEPAFRNLEKQLSTEKPGGEAEA